jgi:hypothetical protein
MTTKFGENQPASFSALMTLAPKSSFNVSYKKVKKTKT